MEEKKLTVEDFAALIDRMSESDKVAAYNVLYGMLLGKTATDEKSAPDPTAA